MGSACQGGERATRERRAGLAEARRLWCGRSAVAPRSLRGGAVRRGELGLLVAAAGWGGAGGATGVFKVFSRGSWASVLGMEATVIAAAIRARERRIAQRTCVIRTWVELLEG